jgi:hypothetical protein
MVTVHVYLPNEAVDVWAAVEAEHLSDGESEEPVTLEESARS